MTDVLKAAESWKTLAIAGGPKEEIDDVDIKKSIGILESRWQSLATCEYELEPYQTDKPYSGWWDDAMWLLAVADEASAGIGFFPIEQNPSIEEKALGIKKGETNPFVQYWTLHYGIWEWLTYQSLSASKTSSKSSKFSNIPKNVFDVIDELLRNTELFKKQNIKLTSLIDIANLRKVLEEDKGLPFSPSSLCIMVPHTELCVQPKTRTSTVGCTLRSLSHHLALLPPASQVETFWRVASPFLPTGSLNSLEPQALNLLLVPFPYSIPGSSFVAAGSCSGSTSKDLNIEGENRAKFFDVDQKWLKASDSNEDLTADQMSDFLIDLIKQAEQEVDQVHGIILPELALSSRTNFMERVSERLRQETRLEIFISGVLLEGQEGQGKRNGIIGSVLHTTEPKARGIHAGWEQAKHHRWKVERHQIRRYHLGGRLDPHVDWWEHINISRRQCNFVVFRHEACLAAIVCEDLARIDPVQTAIRSIGPNLLIALLMDGPQTENRWSGRYATVLADDPGCAVLSLTSMGLLRRSAMPGLPSACQIALWKEAGGERAVELTIPPDYHGLLMTLSYKTENSFTIDGRRDVNRTLALSLSGLQPIKHPKLPPWLSGETETKVAKPKSSMANPKPNTGKGVKRSASNKPNSVEKRDVKRRKGR